MHYFSEDDNKPIYRRLRQLLMSIHRVRKFLQKKKSTFTFKGLKIWLGSTLTYSLSPPDTPKNKVLFQNRMSANANAHLGCHLNAQAPKACYGVWREGETDGKVFCKVVRSTSGFRDWQWRVAREGYEAGVGGGSKWKQKSLWDNRILLFHLPKRNPPGNTDYGMVEKIV